MLIQRRKIVWIEPFMIRENFWYLTIYRVSCAGKFACFAPASISPDLDFVVICVWPRVTRVARSQGEVPQLSLAPRISIQYTGYWILYFKVFSSTTIPHTGRENGCLSISKWKILAISSSKFKFLTMLPHCIWRVCTLLYTDLFPHLASQKIKTNGTSYSYSYFYSWGQVFLF